jgi:hypothetical protein
MGLIDSDRARVSLPVHADLYAPVRHGVRASETPRSGPCSRSRMLASMSVKSRVTVLERPTEATAIAGIFAAGAETSSRRSKRWSNRR